MKLPKLFALLLLITVVVSSCSTKKSNKMLITYDVPRSMPEVFVINKRDSLESTYSHKIKAGAYGGCNGVVAKHCAHHARQRHVH